MRKRLWTRQNTLAISPVPFRRSSAVEQLTVNQFVVGSIPTAGAILPQKPFIIQYLLTFWATRYTKSVHIRYTGFVNGPQNDLS